MNKCYSVCPDGTVGTIDGNKDTVCIACDSSCLKCQVTDVSKCTDCDYATMVLAGTACVDFQAMFAADPQALLDASQNIFMYYMNKLSTVADIPAD